jgi:hypothetical protein
MTIWSISRPFGLFYDPLVLFVAIRYILWLFDIFSRFGRSHKEKSGNPGDLIREGQRSQLASRMQSKKWDEKNDKKINRMRPIDNRDNPCRDN